MQYEQLTSLLTPGQFAQLEVVRKHLLGDPAALDKPRQAEPVIVEESGNG